MSTQTGVEQGSVTRLRQPKAPRPARRGSPLHVMLALLAALLAWLPGQGNAHDLEESYLFITLGDRLEVRAELGVADLNKVLNLGLPEDGSLQQAGLARVNAAIEAYVLARVSIAPDGQQIALAAEAATLRDTSFAQFVLLPMVAASPATTPAFIDVRNDLIFDTVPDHRSILVVENNWLTSTFDNEAIPALLFSAEDRSGRLDLESSSVLNGLAGMIRLGTEHIWEGIDHILFLIALLIPSVMRREDNRWQALPSLKPAVLNVVKIVTLFTVAHSVTLSLATLNIVSVPSRMVESIIALSIAIVALEIIRPMFGAWTYAAVFGFGLFHGFGFASILAEMPIPSSYIAWSLLGFNVGVELGQLVIVLIAVPVLFLLRHLALYPRLFMPLSASALILIATYWFVERAFAVDLPAGEIVNNIFGWA